MSREVCAEVFRGQVPDLFDLLCPKMSEEVNPKGAKSLTQAEPQIPTRSAQGFFFWKKYPRNIGQN